jgi:hypothetical protein
MRSRLHMIAIDLKKLAMLKIKQKLVTDLLKEEHDRVMALLKSDKDMMAKDPDGILSASIIKSANRSFNLEGVREVFGEQSKLCIEEKVVASKFDALAKKSNKYVITEDKQKKCFSISEGSSLNIDGLDVFRNQVEETFNAGHRNT